MAEAIIQINEGTGKKLHAWDRVIGANTVHDEVTIPGEFPYPTYTVTANSVATTTANSHLMQLMAGASNVVRIRRIMVSQHVAAGSVGAFPLQVVRLTTAGTGGGAVTARPFNTAAAAAGATGMTLPTAKGTEGVFLMDRAMWLGTAAIPVRDAWEWVQQDNSQPIIIPAGTTNGIAIKNVLGAATSTVSVTIEFVETSFV